MMFRVLVFAIFGSLLWAEPFVYSNSSSTSSKQIKRNKNSIYKLKQQVARLQEDIDGLRSVIEGLNRTISRLKQQKTNNNSAALNDMAALLDKINQNYISKDDLEKALKTQTVSQVKHRKTTKIKVSQKTEQKGSNPLEKASSSALYSRGVRLVNKKQYTEAKKRFEILAQRGYKKASTHFYLGEIAYRTGKYQTAIDEYRKSAEINDNAGYMDKLLLHTGLAMEKTGDEEQAKGFFHAIVDAYPGTASAKIAKKHLR